MSTELLPCPFCGRAPTWVEQSGSYGYTPPSLSLGCGCAMNPHASRDTEKWEQGRGHFTVDPRPELIAAWNTRAAAKDTP